MNIASDPKSIPTSTLLSPEANQTAALASATGVLTVDLDAIVANWRKLEKTAVPAECAGVVKADGYGCGAEQVARALANAGCKTRSAIVHPFCRTATTWFGRTPSAVSATTLSTTIFKSFVFSNTASCRSALVPCFMMWNAYSTSRRRRERSSVRQARCCRAGRLAAPS